MMTIRAGRKFRKGVPAPCSMFLDEDMRNCGGVGVILFDVSMLKESFKDLEVHQTRLTKEARLS